MVVATFGNADVTHVLNSLTCPFEVHIRAFGDPQPGVYKYLKLTDGECVLVGEGDVVLNLKSCIRDPPRCARMSSLKSYVAKKNGLWIPGFADMSECYKSVAQDAKSIDMFSQTTAMDRDAYHFVVCCDSLLSMQNPLEFLCMLSNVISDGGYMIVAVPSVGKATVSDIETNTRFHTYLEAYDGKFENTTPIEMPNIDHDFNLLRALLRFALLTPIYSQLYNTTQIIVARKARCSFTPSPNAISNQAFVFSQLPEDVKLCPHCGELFCKDDRCSFVYCGLGGDDVFRVGFGCGKSFCYQCGKKYCGQHYDPVTGRKLDTYSSKHSATCCREERGFQEFLYCPGGHSDHCAKRW